MLKMKWIIVIAIVVVGLGVGLGVGLTRGGGGTTPEEAPPAATIAYSPSSFGFHATEGGANPLSQTLEIWNSGGGTLNWSVSDDADWLSMSPTNGTSTDVTVSVDIAGMTADDYNATITISASGATNTPQTVAVSLHIGTVAAEPTIAFGPPSFNLTATEGGANPAPKTLSIWNSGSGTLNWFVNENVTWLILGPPGGTSTGEHDAVDVLVNIAGLTEGEYTTDIIITAPGAANTPQTVSMSLTIEAPPAEPTIAFHPASLDFSATEGGDNPSNQTLSIWNSGSGTLSWSVSDDADWLSLNPTSGDSTGEHDSVTVSVDITGMDAVSYNATITISATGATNTPQTVSVSLDISSAAAAELPGTYSYTMDYSDTTGLAMSMVVQVKEGVGARTDWTMLTPSAMTVIFISDGEFDWYYSPDYHMAFQYCPDSGMNPGAAYTLWFTEYYYGSLSEGEILTAMQAGCALEPTCDSVAITGHETILSEYCTIFTITMTDGSTMSIWLPVGSGGWLMKWEYTDAMTGITSTMQFTDIDLSPTIPDSTFDVGEVFAQGTTIYDMTGPECAD